MGEITDLFLQVTVAILAALCYAILGTSAVEKFSLIEYGNMQGSVMWFHEAMPLVVLGTVF